MLKSEFGVGETQCWGAVNGVWSVQYGLWVLSGYLVWGICGGVRYGSCWWVGGSGRWSFRQLRGWLAAGLEWIEALCGVCMGDSSLRADWWGMGQWLLWAQKGWLLSRCC